MHCIHAGDDEAWNTPFQAQIDMDAEGRISWHTDLAGELAVDSLTQLHLAALVDRLSEFLAGTDVPRTPTP